MASWADAALALGHKLVAGDTRQQRIAAWLDACRDAPNGYLCCARGGQRSHIAQAWLKEAGVDYPLVKGGYKMLRQTAIQATVEQVQKPMVLIGGCTGNGKTQLVCSRPDGIDLEGHAHHRGSSFGRTLQPQHPQARPSSGTWTSSPPSSSEPAGSHMARPQPLTWIRQTPR